MTFDYDPAREWDRYCNEEERELARRPICPGCGERIVEDSCFLIGEEYYCEDCTLRLFHVATPIADYEYDEEDY